MIYIEKLILIDLLIHISFIYLTSMICAIKVRKINILFSSIINIVLIIIYIYFYKNILLNLFFSVVIALISFLGVTIKMIIKEAILYLLLNILLGGLSEILYICNIKGCLALIALVFFMTTIVIAYMIFFKINISFNCLIYEMYIVHKRKKYRLIGYLDTGNFMQSENNVPVIVLSTKYKIGDFIKNERCITISGQKELKLYKVDNIYLKIKKRYKPINAYIVYSHLNYDCMFGLKIIEG